MAPTMPQQSKTSRKLSYWTIGPLALQQIKIEVNWVLPYIFDANSKTFVLSQKNIASPWLPWFSQLALKQPQHGTISHVNIFIDEIQRLSLGFPWIIHVPTYMNHKGWIISAQCWNTVTTVKLVLTSIWEKSPQ